MKDRNTNLDALRIFACFLIVLVHSAMPTDGSNGILQSSISYFGVSGIGLFFMISGYFILPVTMPTVRFLKHRLIKLIWPTLLWTLIYMGLGWMCDGYVPGLRSILSIPFSTQGNGILWYMYTIIGLYLVAPIISPWLKNVQWREARLYLCIIALVFFMPIIQICLTTNTSPTGTFYYFSGFIGYFILGWAMKRFGDKMPRLGWLSLGFVMSIAVAAICKLCHIEVDFYSVFWYYSIFVLIQSLFWFKLFNEKINFDISARNKGRIELLSNLTLGIYLVHIIIVRRFLWHLQWINEINSYLLQTFIIAVLGFVISAVVCWLISLLPVGKYIIGYKKQMCNFDIAK